MTFLTVDRPSREAADRPGPSPGRVLAAVGVGALIVALGIVLLTTSADTIGAAVLAPAVLYAAAVLVLVPRLPSYHPYARLGLANALTLWRLAVVCVLAGVAAMPTMLAGETAAWLALTTALTVLVLDGLDGWAARRQGLCSRFGARFDMEVDALLGVVLAALALGQGKVGAWVLLLAGLRYLFLAGQALWPVLRRPLPDSLRRKVVCVFQLSVLCALLAPPIDGVLASSLAATAMGALTWSFAVDIRWLIRSRPVAG